MKFKDKQAYQRYLEKLEIIRQAGQGRIDANENKAQKQERIERAKKDYAFFVATYFPHYATAECAPFHIKAANKVKKERYFRGIMEWARSLAKSTHFNILIPMWLWINEDIKVMVLVGKSQTDANRLLSDIQAEFEANPMLINDFGDQQNLGSWQEGDFVTKNRCAFRALGRGQSPRGLRYGPHRPDYIICDDIDDDILIRNPKRVDDTVDWILSALIGTGDIGRLRFILVNNRIGNHTILTEMLKRPGMYHSRVDGCDEQFNPIWPAKYTKKFYQDLYAFMGPVAFNKEHRNNPQVEGKIFKSEMFQWVKMPRLNSFKLIVAHWDIAFSDSKSADTNAVRMWALKDDRFYLLRCFVRHSKVTEVIEWLYAVQDGCPPSVTIHFRAEKQFVDDSIYMAWNEIKEKRKKARKNPDLNLVFVERSTKNKYDRILTLQPYYQQGRIYFNKAEEGNNDMILGNEQLKGIEPGYKTHDDAPDADEYAISYLARHTESKTDTMPVIGPAPNPNSLW